MERFFTCLRFNAKKIYKVNSSMDRQMNETIFCTWRKWSKIQKNKKARGYQKSKWIKMLLGSRPMLNKKSKLRTLTAKVEEGTNVSIRTCWETFDSSTLRSSKCSFWSNLASQDKRGTMTRSLYYFPTIFCNSLASSLTKNS